MPLQRTRRASRPACSGSILRARRAAERQALGRFVMTKTPFFVGACIVSSALLVASIYRRKTSPGHRATTALLVGALTFVGFEGYSDLVGAATVYSMRTWAHLNHEQFLISRSTVATAIFFETVGGALLCVAVAAGFALSRSRSVRFATALVSALAAARMVESFWSLGSAIFISYLPSDFFGVSFGAALLVYSLTAAANLSVAVFASRQQRPN
jgi:hypothetical protein